MNFMLPDKTLTSEDIVLLTQAIELSIDAGQISASMLQRRFRTGYAKAGSMIDIIEQIGIISGRDGSKPRQVLISRDQFESDVLPKLLSYEAVESTSADLVADVGRLVCPNYDSFTVVSKSLEADTIIGYSCVGSIDDVDIDLKPEAHTPFYFLKTGAALECKLSDSADIGKSVAVVIKEHRIGYIRPSATLFRALDILEHQGIARGVISEGTTPGIKARIWFYEKNKS